MEWRLAGPPAAPGARMAQPAAPQQDRRGKSSTQALDLHVHPKLQMLDRACPFSDQHLSLSLNAAPVQDRTMPPPSSAPLLSKPTSQEPPFERTWPALPPWSSTLTRRRTDACTSFRSGVTSIRAQRGRFPVRTRDGEDAGLGVGEFRNSDAGTSARSGVTPIRA